MLSPPPQAPCSAKPPKIARTVKMPSLRFRELSHVRQNSPKVAAANAANTPPNGGTIEAIEEPLVTVTFAVALPLAAGLTELGTIEQDGTAPCACPDATTWQESEIGFANELSKLTVRVPLAACPRVMGEGLRVNVLRENKVPAFSRTDTVFSAGLVTTRSAAPSPFRSEAAIPDRKSVV